MTTWQEQVLLMEVSSDPEGEGKGTALYFTGIPFSLLMYVLAVALQELHLPLTVTAHRLTVLLGCLVWVA